MVSRFLLNLKTIKRYKYNVRRTSSRSKKEKSGSNE